MIGNLTNSKRFYEYDPDSNSFAGVSFSVGDTDDEDDDDATVTKLHGSDMPVARMWCPLTCRCFEGSPPSVGDFPSVSNYRLVPMMSERAWNALNPIIGDVCEALSVNHPFMGTYYLVHVLRTIEALDEDAIEVKRRSADDSRIRLVLRYAFRQDKIDGLHMFKLANRQGGGLIVDDVFRKVVEDKSLRGLRFTELPVTQ